MDQIIKDIRIQLGKALDHSEFCRDQARKGSATWSYYDGQVAAYGYAINLLINAEVRDVSHPE